MNHMINHKLQALKSKRNKNKLTIVSVELLVLYSENN